MIDIDDDAVGGHCHGVGDCTRRRPASTIPLVLFEADPRVGLAIAKLPLPYLIRQQNHESPAGTVSERDDSYPHDCAGLLINVPAVVD